MDFYKPVIDLIQQRYSCRTYQNRPIAAEKRRQLEDVMSNLRTGPLGTAVRFVLLAVTAQDSAALRGLGTYGIIRGAMAFIVGAVSRSPTDMEDFGYCMEQIVLSATDLDLGTCWLGGTFTKSRFAERISLQQGEVLPAIASVGHIAEKRSLVDRIIRQGAGSHHRYPWERLFFDGHLGAPLTRQAAGPFALPLEMVRLAPSASNKQPWRVIHAGDAWHFCLQRTPVYGTGGMRLMGVADLQRVDMGIAMCHFSLSAQELGLAGVWTIEDPALSREDEAIEYCASWLGG